jgi:hypothetical protein
LLRRAGAGAAAPCSGMTEVSVVLLPKSSNMQLREYGSTHRAHWFSRVR